MNKDTLIGYVSGIVIAGVLIAITLALGGCSGIGGWMHNDNMGGLSQGVGQIMGGR